MRRVAVLLALACVGVAGCSSDVRGPDFAGIADLESFLRVANGYSGPFTVSVDSGRDDSGHTLRWDGTDVSLRPEPASPINEWRLVTAHGVTTCYQQVDGTWVGERVGSDRPRRNLLDGISAIATFNEFRDWDPDEVPDARVDLAEDRFGIVGLRDPRASPDRIDRIDFTLDDGRLTGAEFLDARGETILTERYSFEDDPDVVAPPDDGDGMDVTC